MKDRFTNTNARQPGLRWLEAQRLMDKYTTGWRCSACGKQFALTESERIAVESDDFDVPSRVRLQFENHKCDSASMRKGPNPAMTQIDESA
jgi:hypothetical protein